MNVINNLTRKEIEELVFEEAKYKINRVQNNNTENPPQPIMLEIPNINHPTTLITINDEYMSYITISSKKK